MPENDDLSKQIHITEWQYLAASHARGSLIWVSHELDLLSVGQAVVTDDKSKVSSWLEAEQMSSCPDRLAIAQHPLRTFIAAPYVLVQELSEDERQQFNRESAEKLNDAVSPWGNRVKCSENRAEN